MEKRYLSLSEAAGALGISERTAHRWIKSGKLRSYKPGRDHKIPESAIIEAIEAGEVRPKAHRRSSLEPSLLNGLEDERRLSRFSEAIIAAAGRWGEAMSSLDTTDSKRFGLIDAALSLSDVISERAEAEDWEALPNQERLEIVTTMEKLGEAAEQGLRHLEESEEARAQEEQVNQRREQIREWTRRISA
jgi:excisionase family DNA binding protein